MQYLCTYGSGWDKAINSILKNKFITYKINSIDNGIVIFETDEMIDVKKMAFFNNVYMLLSSIKCKSDNFDNNVIELINRMKLNYNTTMRNYIKKMNVKSFKIMSIDGNKPCKINYNNILRLEKEIQNNLNIRVSKDKHDLDFLFLRRSNGMLYFLLKLSYGRITEKNIEQGSLRSEVSYLLASLADIKESDIVLDPFTGSGSIPKEIIKRYKYNMLFASDLDIDKYNKLKREFKGNNKHFFIKNFDALSMKFFENNFVDVIVTDPPWNIYEHKDENYQIFYYKMLGEFNRIVKNDGRIVILMGNEIDFENALRKVEKLKLEDKLSVLINGKKAKVYILRKKV